MNTEQYITRTYPVIRATHVDDKIAYRISHKFSSGHKSTREVISLLRESKGEIKMIQDNELVNLLSGLAAIMVLVFIAGKVERGKLYFFYAAFGAMLCAYTTTILEGYFWPIFFNWVEHFSLAAAGILFALGSWHLYRNGEMDTNGN